MQIIEGVLLKTIIINDSNFINNVYNLLLTDKLFNHQLESYTEKNEADGNVVKEL